MTSNSLSVINGSSRAEIENHLVSKIDAWASKWFLLTPEVNFEFNDKLFSFEFANDTDTVWRVADGHIAFSNVSSSFLSESLLNMSGYAEAQKDIVFWEELKRSFETSFVDDCLKGEVKEKVNTKKLSIALTATILVGEKELRLKFDINTLVSMGLMSKKSHVDPSVKIVSIENALMLNKVRLLAKLKAVDITLEQLINLKSGDFIKLNHPLEAPVILQAPSGSVNTNAFLVKNANMKALFFSK
ncbi:FliM/FliN family flagellar motor switch protein [Flocculibacter collagenilyticus]|uniref:FliM/FliN family flagellar motor switch protein n=1 Tax=Flocculibacter collagenilyticus TaxID=2744479 RepID=UPI0018F3B222|nr:FliM/FliN family flagellar motor switch protein [Flocculibacter collagenilyticus]